MNLKKYAQHGNSPNEPPAVLALGADLLQDILFIYIIIN